MWDTEPQGAFYSPSQNDVRQLIDALMDYLNDGVDEREAVRRPSEAEMGALHRTGSIERAMEDDDLMRLAQDLDVLRQGMDVLRTSRPGSAKPVTLRPNLKSKALSAIAHIEASHMPAVEGFRRDALGDQLLGPDAVGAWVEMTAETDGPATGFIRIPSDAKKVPRTPEDFAAIDAIHYERDWLAYPGPTEWIQTTPVRADGVLDRLRRLAETLNRSWGWHPAAAVWFVLTGLEVPPARGRTTVSHKHPYPARSTVTIEVVAESVSKREVAEMYAQAIAESHLNAAAGVGRPMGAKHAQLAITAAEHAHSDRTWRSSMRRWNKKTGDPEWKYTDWRRFGHDAREAFKRVTGQRLDTNRNPETTEDQ